MSNLLTINKLNQLIKITNKVRDSFVLPQRLRGGRIERLVNYGGNVLRDYRQAVEDIFNDALKNPTKTYIYLSLIGTLSFLYKTNPHPNSFKSELINYQNLMSLIGEPIRNANCYNYLYELNNLDNQRLLHKINFLIFTIYVRKEFNKDLKIYQANCAYLQPSFLDYLRNRIVDVGIGNRWILLEKKLKDFDINPNEWKNVN